MAREIEVGLPVELSKSEHIALARDFAHHEFVAKGMVADFGVHLDNPQNPRAHILLTTRDLTPQRIASANDKQIIAEPTIALKALSRTNATFTHHDLAKFLHTRTDSSVLLPAPA